MTTKHNRNVVVIDYAMGNVASAKKAFEKLGANVSISRITRDIAAADYLVLPGVGAFGDAMANLKKFKLIAPLNEQVLKKKKPFLGICLGMQLLAEKGFEFGEHTGLGWIKGEVVKLATNGLRLPHIGWNEIRVVAPASFFSDIPDNNFYFVHSFHLKPKIKSIITATCAYGETFAASIRQDNIFATQFHPEKSQVSGMRVLENFLRYAK